MKFNYFIMILVVLLLSACSFKPVNMPSKKQYTVSAVSQTAYRKTPSHQTILVTMPTAAPAFQTSAMVYMTSPYRVQHFNYSRWVAEPAEMLLPLIAESVDNSHYFSAVVTPPYSQISNYRLDIKILNFAQQFFDNSSQFNFALRATLINQTTHHVIGSKQFRAAIRAKANTPQAGVKAANLAVKQVLQQLTRFSVKVIKRQ